MTIIKLPYVGEHLSVDDRGRVTLFGFTASGEHYRPVLDPESGNAWPDTDKGWQRRDSRVVGTIRQMIEANQASRPAGDRGQFRLDVSPEIFAQLFMNSVVTVYDIMLHTELTVEGRVKTPAIQVALPKQSDKAKENGDEISPGASWREFGGIHAIRVSPFYTGAEIAWLDQE